MTSLYPHHAPHGATEARTRVAPHRTTELLHLLREWDAELTGDAA